MSFLGDYTLGDTFYFRFTTRRFSTGAPHTLAGTPSLKAYEAGSDTQITAGITLTADFDSVTGLNSVEVVATSGNGFENGKDYDIVIHAGTVDSVSVAGEVVGRFTIGRSAAAVDLANATDGLSALKTLIDTIDDFLDTEIAAIKAKTDNLPSDPADASVIAGRFDTVDTALTTIEDFLDTEVAAIKAKTDNLPSDPADASDIAASFSSVAASLSTILGHIDTEISALITAVDAVPTNAELATALAAADDAVLAAIAALNNLSAAQVASEIADALGSDTYAEPTGVPSTTASIAAKLGLLHMVLVNGLAITATKKQFKDAAGNVEFEKDLADDGTTYTETAANAP